jgi:hypothetical protein
MDNELKHYGAMGMSWGKGTNSEDSLEHFGKLGMKWGQRHAENKLNKTAKKDATKHEVARQAYGKGAGIQRRLVKKEIDEKMKNPQYKAAYDKALSEINYSKINNKAISNSRGRATKDQASRSAKIVAKTLTGTTSLAAGYILYTQNKPAIDHAVSSALKSAKTAVNTYKTAQTWKKNFG